jgi:hypothetical protein
MLFPEMALVRQRLHTEKLEDVAGAVTKALSGLSLMEGVRPGASVAVAVGSRAISNLAAIVSQCVQVLKNKGLAPFIVPAMGSHGRNTPEGESSVLNRLGIDESSVGAPICAGGDPKEIGTLEVGIPVLMDKYAAEADHLVVVNRVKPHTKFHGPFESGLTKMLTIGLGKGKGAALYHQAAVQHTFSILQDAAEKILEDKSILFGLAILEDSCGDVSQVIAVKPGDWFETEQDLLKEARLAMAAIPFDPLDILIVDEIGKDISGIGMDSNVTGRHRDIVGDFCLAPHVKRIFARDLSPGSDGNGNGIGLADVTTVRLVEALDLAKTYENALTAISPEKAAIPIHFETDRQCIQACLNTIGMIGPDQVRVVRVRNTATLGTLWVSKALEGDVRSRPELTLVSPWNPMTFDGMGNLVD